MYIVAGGKLLVRHQIIVHAATAGISSRIQRASLLLHGSLLHGHLLLPWTCADLHRHPCNQRQRQHGGGCGKRKPPRILFRHGAWSKHHRLFPQTLAQQGRDIGMKMTRLAQRVPYQMIGMPLCMCAVVPLQAIQQCFRFVIKQLAIHQRRNALFHIHHLFFSLVPNSGRKFSAIASRARKMRERTVPIGQPITSAISS